LKTGKLICFDKDIEALNQSKQILEKISSNFILIKSDFRFLTQELEKIGIYAVDGVLADLGVSSPQLDNVNRGFSYSRNSDLDMRMDLDNTISAKEIVNQLNYVVKHGTTLGSSREYIWKSLFERIVPKKFNIDRSVFIIDSYGNISKEVDLAIYDEQYTPYI